MITDWSDLSKYGLTLDDLAALDPDVLREYLELRKHPLGY